METRDKGQVRFYYNREERLKKASDNARFISESYQVKRPGIVRSLTATRSLRYLFFTLIFMAVAIMVIGFVQRSRSQASVAGTSLSASAMWFEGQVYVTVKKAAPWYSIKRPDAGARNAPSASVIQIRTGDGIGYATGILQPADQELRLRFRADAKPDGIAVLADAFDSGGAIKESAELLVSVE